MEQKKPILNKFCILLISVSLFTGILKADTDTLFDYDSLYLAGRYAFIIDSLDITNDQSRLIKARTLMTVGFPEQAQSLLDGLDGSYLQAAALYYRSGEYRKASLAAVPFAGGNDFVSNLSLYIIGQYKNDDRSSRAELWRQLAGSPIPSFKATADLNLALHFYDMNIPDSARYYVENLNQSSLRHLERPLYHFLKSKMALNDGENGKALDCLVDALKSNHLFECSDMLVSYAVDSLAPMLDQPQRISLVNIFRRGRYYGEAFDILKLLEDSDLKSLEQAWCHFGQKHYSMAAGIFKELELSADPEIRSEAAYGHAVSVYRQGRRLDGVEMLVDFAEKFPDHKLAPRALFTAADFYQQNDNLKSIDILNNLVSRYERSRYYPRSLYLMSKQYLEFGSKVKALEALGLFNFEDDNADLFDYWQFKLSPADSGYLADIIKRKFPSFYNYRARWDLGLDEPDSIFSYGAFLDDFLVRAEKFISWRLKSQPFDSSVMAFADSLQFYGLDYEAGLYLVNLHETAADMMFDIDLLRKCYKLKLDRAFFEILQDFTASLRQKGYSFSRDAWDRLQYPLLYRDLVNYHARGLIDPYLALSVIRRESRFDPMAVSSVGAIGLMQLMPATAAQMANMGEVPLVWLFEPGYNIMLGCRYLRWLSARLAKNEVVIAAYNAGPTAAKRWQRMASDETESYIETIGYDQSRDYTRWVIGDFYWYKYFWPIEF